MAELPQPFTVGLERTYIRRVLLEAMNLDSTSTKVHSDATRALKKTVVALFIRSQVSTITRDSFVCRKDRTMFLLSPGQLHSALPGRAQFAHPKLKEQGFEAWKFDKNVYQLCDEVARLLCRLADSRQIAAR